MLTTAPHHAAALVVRIDVASIVVRLALSYVAEDRGWGVCDHISCRCVRISDSIRCETDRVDVLVIRDDPAACQDALDAVLAGRARSVVLWDEPETLTATVEALRQGAAVVPERVIALAQDVPRLSQRHRQTLRLVAAGRSNPEIARVLHQSASTTKRDIAELFQVFDAPNRASLMSIANRLGFL